MHVSDVVLFCRLFFCGAAFVLIFAGYRRLVIAFFLAGFFVVGLAVLWHLIFHLCSHYMFLLINYLRRKPYLRDAVCYLFAICAAIVIINGDLFAF